MRLASMIFAAGAVLALSGCAAVGITPEKSANTASASPELPSELASATLISFAAPASLPDPLPPARPDGLWTRIRGGFELPDADDPAIQRERSYFAARQGYLDRVAERAEPYLYHIVQEVQERGLPTELALLPIVESAFRPFAYSHGRAAGLWQFIPSTARHYGLKINWWYDGRRDVIAATDAALDYLAYLHDFFEGDWLLAVAAYNAGEGTVRRAMRRNAERGRPTDFWHLNLPRETENYVPRLLAVRDLVQAPEVYGVNLPYIANEPRIAVVEIDSQIDLALAAELTGISIDTLYRLNPGFNRWATAPEGPHRLVLPLERQQRFREGLAATPAAERVQWRRHSIEPGDTLIEIAHRYHTTVEVLRQTNDLGGSMIRAGEHLIVPVASRPTSAYTLSAAQRRASLLSRDREGHKVVYTVRRGDTLWGISRRYDVGVRQLAAWNGMAPTDTLRPGRRLAVWSDGVEIASGGPSGRIQSVRYTVESGDSLWAIAQRFSATVADLRRWNDIDRGEYLQPGQVLTLEVDVTRLADR